jgi:glyoxylase-like metal-dependent hydrolase (beta-lactamase superfamily II)
MEIKSIKLKIPWPFFEVNVFILKEGDRFALIDTGFPTEENFYELEKAIFDICGGWQKLEFIILTHGHPDHYGNAREILNKVKVPIFVHEKDKDRVIELPKEIRREAAEFAVEFLIKNGVPQDKLSIVERQSKSYFTRKYQVEEQDIIPIQDEIYFGGTKIRVFHTPGHTPGHIILYIEKEGTIFSGDHIFSRGFPVPLLFFPKKEDRFRNLPNWLRSLKILEELDISCVFPGHLEPFSNVKEVVSKMRKRVEKQKEKVLKIILESPKTLYEIGNSLYPDLPDEFWTFKFSEAQGYIDVLQDEGLVSEKIENGQIKLLSRLC